MEIDSVYKRMIEKYVRTWVTMNGKNEVNWLYHDKDDCRLMIM